MNISENFTLHRETRSGSQSRESTAPLEDDTRGDTSFPSLHLTFNPGPRGSRGLEFGTDPHCDIVLPKLRNKKISRVHCALTFDSQRRLILRDFLKHGTVVEYDGKGGESRHTSSRRIKKEETPHHFKWILGGDDIPETKNIVIHIQGISFLINVSPHENSRKYNANVDGFLQQVKGNQELPLGKFSIKSLDSTAAPSGAETPSHDPIRLKQETLRRGSLRL